jgi:uncharacterized phage protein (TIGR01671 family)
MDSTAGAVPGKRGIVMEDRYLFRGKRIDNGEWVQDYLFDDGFENGRVFVGGLVIEKYNGTACDDWTVTGINFCEINPNTICQCTGLKDKNGNLIWENDIVETQYGKAIVIWDKLEWRIKWIDDLIWRKDLHYWANDNSWRIEVIGNKFDNPELLEV